MTTQEPKAEVKLSRAKVVEQEPKTVLYISATGDYKKVDYMRCIWDVGRDQAAGTFLGRY